MDSRKGEWVAMINWQPKNRAESSRSRDTAYNRSNFFEDYVKACEYETQSQVPRHSCVITVLRLVQKIQTVFLDLL